MTERAIINPQLAVYAERLMAKCEPQAASGCWHWTGALRDKGYGHMKFEGRYAGAHRVSYLLFVGGIPDGMMVCHRCDNPRCINPDHLWLGTCRDNLHDMVAKGRHRSGVSKGSSNGSAKLSDADVAAIRAAPKVYGSGRRLAAHFGVNEASICEIRAGRRWGHL